MEDAMDAILHAFDDVVNGMRKFNKQFYRHMNNKEEFMMSTAFRNVKEVLPEIIERMAKYEYNVKLLSGAERKALAQVSAEAGFANDSNEFVELKKKLIKVDRRLEDMEVINQHTVWIGDHNELHITVFENEDVEHDKIVASLRDLPDLQKEGWITHNTAMLVFEWYMEQRNKER